MSDTILSLIGCLNRPNPYFAGSNGRGIEVARFDPATATFSPVGFRSGIDNPSFLAIHPNGRFAYAVSEVHGWNEGTVTAYRLDEAADTLTYLNKQATLGSIAAHVGFDRAGRFVFVSNYAMDEPGDLPGQAVAVFPIRDDGGLGAAASSVAFAGSGPHRERQDQPHPHCALASPDNRFVLAADLGTDRVLAIPFDAATGALAPDGWQVCATPPGSGPRHLVWDTTGTRIFVSLELGSGAAILDYDPRSGALRLLDEKPALPDDFSGENTCSDLQLTADGRFLFVANRGHDSIARFAVERDALRPIGHTPVGGRTPRQLAIDPTGRCLTAANQGSDGVTVFTIEGGDLTQVSQLPAGSPMCVAFAGSPSTPG